MTNILDRGNIRSIREIDQLVEDGKFFGASPILVVDQAVNSLVSVTTAPTARVHAYIAFVSTVQAQVNVYLTPTITTPGTLVPFTNFFIGHSNTVGTTMRTAPVVGANGTKIADFLIPGGSGGNAVGGAAENAAKVILPPNTTFLFEFDNQGAGGVQPIEFTVNLFEVPL